MNSIPNERVYKTPGKRGVENGEKVVYLRSLKKDGKSRQDCICAACGGMDDAGMCAVATGTMPRCAP